MAARERNRFETFKAYRKNLKKEQAMTDLRLKGRPAKGYYAMEAKTNVSTAVRRAYHEKRGTV